jgi:hypothetical protein
MATDPARGSILLFAGAPNSSAQHLADTWLWNGRTWAPRGSSGPGARWFGAMASHPNDGAVVLFGGQADRQVGREAVGA